MSNNQQEAREWLPIPEGLRGEFLLYFPAIGGRNALSERVKVDRYPVTYPRQPTHYMPIPPSPKAEMSFAEYMGVEPQLPAPPDLGEML